MDQAFYNLPEFLKKRIINVLKTSGKESAINFCMRYLSIKVACTSIVESLEQSLE